MLPASDCSGIPFTIFLAYVKFFFGSVILASGTLNILDAALPAYLSETSLKDKPGISSVFISTTASTSDLFTLSKFSGLILVSLTTGFSSTTVSSATISLASGESSLSASRDNPFTSSYICCCLGLILLSTNVENLAVLGSNLSTIPGKNSLAADKTSSLLKSPLRVSYFKAFRANKSN